MARTRTRYPSRKRQREVRRQAARVASRYGWDVGAITLTRGGHIKVELTQRGKRRCVYFSLTPGDWRADRNASRSITAVLSEEA